MSGARIVDNFLGALLVEALGQAGNVGRTVAGLPNVGLSANSQGKFLIGPQQAAGVYQNLALYNLLSGLTGAEKVDPAEFLSDLRQENRIDARDLRTKDLALGQLNVAGATNPAIASATALG